MQKGIGLRDGSDGSVGKDTSSIIMATRVWFQESTLRQERTEFTEMSPDLYILWHTCSHSPHTMYTHKKSSRLTYVKFLLFKYGRSLICLVLRPVFTSWFNCLTTKRGQTLLVFVLSGGQWLLLRCPKAGSLWPIEAISLVLAFPRKLVSSLLQLYKLTIQ